MNLRDVIMILILSIVIVTGLFTFAVDYTDSYSQPLNETHMDAIKDIKDIINETEELHSTIQEKVESSKGIGVIDAVEIITDEGIAAIKLVFYIGPKIIFVFITSSTRILGLPSWFVGAITSLAVISLGFIILGILSKRDV